MSNFFVVLILTFALFVQGASAKILPAVLEGIESFQPVIEEIETVTKDGVVLKGVRYRNDTGPRIVTLHGFSGNTRNWREFARVANRQGFDFVMYNFRGHGNGTHKSINPKIPTNSSKRSKGFYGLDKIITQDVPAIIENSYDGRPLILMGHSLGGVALRQFLSGVREGPNGVFVTKDPRRLNKYLNKVRTLVTLGSPTSFDQQDDIRFKIVAELPKEFLNLMIAPVARGTTPTQTESWLGKTREEVADSLKDLFHRSYLAELFMYGLINTANIKKGIERNELGRMMSKGISIVPADLLDDAKRWAKDGFKSRNNISYTGMPVPQNLSFFQIVGALDKLVPPQDIVREHEMFATTFNPRVISFQNFSHIDLAVGYGAAPILQTIVERVYQNPNPSDLKSITQGLKQVQILKPKMTCIRLF